MSLFNEALYWEALERCVRTDEGGPCMDREAGVACRSVAIDKARAAQLKIAGDRRNENEGETPGTSPVDVYVELHDTLDGGSAPSLGDDALADFYRGPGAPAYVIPLQPRLAHGESGIRPRGLTDYVNLVDASLQFQWLVRNAYDEPLFDYSQLIDAGADNPSEANQCDRGFCVRLDDGLGRTRDWPLNDLGLGLFASGPITTTHAEMTASPGAGESIQLWGDLEVSLVYTVDGEDEVELNAGSLPITTLGELSAEVEVNPDEDATDCLTCYIIDVDALLKGEGVEISKLSLSEQGEPPSLIFKATLNGKIVVPDAPATNPDDEAQVELVDEAGVIELTRRDGQGRFSGQFPSVELDPNKHYVVRVFVEDRNGRVKGHYWIDIRIPA
jgi:hypothetical protein